MRELDLLCKNRPVSRQTAPQARLFVSASTMKGDKIDRNRNTWHWIENRFKHGVQVVREACQKDSNWLQEMGIVHDSKLRMLSIGPLTKGLVGRGTARSPHQARLARLGVRHT